MEYKGTPLNLELINDIVEIPSVQDVTRMEYFLRYITNQFEKPYVLLLLSKGKDADEQAAIFDAIEEEYYREEILDAECIPNRYPNAISTDELRKIEFQLKYKHKAIDPDLGVLMQAYIYRQYPKSKIFKLKGDWYRDGDGPNADVVNWVTDYSVKASDGQVGEIYGDGSNINRVLYDLRSKNWCSRLNTEDFLQVLEPAIDFGARLLETYDFQQFYRNLFQEPWATDPTTPYAQKRQSIIDELLAEHQCGGPISADNPNQTYEKTIADLNERIGYLVCELARTTSRLRELEAENNLLKHSQQNIVKGENQQNSQTDNILFAPTALQLWKKLQEADLINAEYKPNKSKISDRKASIIAKILGTQLGLDPLWEPFEKLWNIRKLSNALSQTNNAKYRDSFEAEIRRVLD